MLTSGEQIDLIINGLKDLHYKFSVHKANNMMDEMGEKSSHTKPYEFQGINDQCLQSLKELFLYRIKMTKDRKRI